MSPHSQKILQDIWEKSSQKFVDGKPYLVFKDKIDLEHLYCSGFVDAKKYPLASWLSAFSEAHQPNGSYRLTYDQWIAKAAFHYDGPVGEPFDPMTLREGEWTEEEMEKLIDEKMLPSVFFTPQEFFRIFSESKRQGFFANGVYHVTRETKADWLEFLNKYPSPMRVLEIMIQDAKRSRKSDLTSGDDRASQFVQSTPTNQRAAERLNQLLFKK